MVLLKIRNQSQICIVTFPIEKSGLTPLSNLISITSDLNEKVYVISSKVALEIKTSPNVIALPVSHPTNQNKFKKIAGYTNTQIKILSHVLSLKKVNLFIFFIGGQYLLFPILALKLLGKKIVIMPADVTAKVFSSKKDILSKLLTLSGDAGFFLADKIVLYTPSLMREANLTKYINKVEISHRHFVNFEEFSISEKYEKRDFVVGYIGRLSGEKGILDLVNAIPFVLKKCPNFHFVICGDGPLLGEVKSRLSPYLGNQVSLINWVSHKDVAKFLNRFRLLVVPSFTEGLPNVILESMACGTPVLATPVGGVPDILTEEKTGFLLVKRNPVFIADKILLLLNNPVLLEKVSVTANQWVKDNFSQAKTTKNWEKLLKNFLTKNGKKAEALPVNI